LIVVGIAWFRREDYQRIRDICEGDDMIATFEEWEAVMDERMARLPIGPIYEKVVVDPDELIAFAEAFHGGRVTPRVFSTFAARAVSGKYAD
jgi:hypothetical protein